MEKSEEDKEKERLRAKLNELTAKIPESVRNGSIQQVRDYKESFIKAVKILNKRNSSIPDLHSMVMKMETFK